MLELDVAYLLSHARTQITYQPLPRLSAMERDLAVLVDRRRRLADDAGHARGREELLASVSLLTSMRASRWRRARESVAFSLALRANGHRTLKDEANAVMERCCNGCNRSLAHAFAACKPALLKEETIGRTGQTNPGIR